MIMATSKIHKAFNIDFTAPAQGRSIEVDSQSSKKKTETAPGFMADVLIAESNAIQENKDLKAKLETFDGSLPTRMIDPNLIIRSKWSNRLEQSYQNQDFTNLKTEIANSKGNIQPIKVRPLAGSPGMFEIVFGHRRHQACLETGNQVLAIIEDVNEESLFIEMDRENRQRADLRPYEQGVMYKRAIDEGMFKNSNSMSLAIGVDASNIRKAIAMAELPDPILDAFESRMDIQYAWSNKLNFLLKKNPNDVLTKASEIRFKRDNGESVSSNKALSILLGESNLTPVSHDVEVGSKVFTVTQKGDKTTFEFSSLNNDQVSKIKQFTQELLSNSQ